ncbi:LysM peptidoglycan-binding domain-containing protein [Jeotgalibaca sp. MA1X17-3]|uniref:LysM peptidoglycan-binding domain-containing protein n=1 Tax=Jeotgalibaca sp. MA1X17-3 TaxID=2908211 RepID=UPI001F47C71B|nr:LysM peptidoglycan-binding domain-containing protein [Jeotgalibaca sp. MA1X17-3]UJF14632.1 LysM peptidoglycan-binding domain-containing protein [Jeotgalibaca sp. MA1X17-3]
MSISRKEWLAGKQEKEWNEKIRHSAKKMRMNFAVISASVLLANLVEPVKHVMAAEKTTETQNEVKTYSENPFLNSLVPSASSIAQKNDLYASVMLAQAILESGWGKSTLASEPNHNLFGIKGNYEGESVNMGTLEDSGNQNYYPIQADFRKYPSYHESLEDYASLLRNGTGWDPLFYDGVWKSNASSYQEATSYLTGRYATDSAYNSKLNKIIESNELTKYDTPSTTVPSVGTEEVVDQNISAATNTSYTVKSGDTLYAIAGKYGISLNDLMKWNQLTSSFLQIGDILLVSNKKVETPVNTPVSFEKVDTEESAVEQSKPTSLSVYKVKSGDSLWKIGQLNNVTVAQLKEWNNLKTDIIQPGQSLRLMNQVAQEENTVTVPEKPTTESKPVQNQPVQTITSKTVTVASGDTLYKIANQANVSVAQLTEWNQLKSTIIYPGQKLILQVNKANTGTTPSKEESIPVKDQVVENVKPATSSKAYSVKSGDTLYRIANQAGVSVKELKEWNQLNSNIILIGQKLQIAKATTPIQVEESTSQTTEKVSQTHSVKSGDTLYAISKQYGVSITQLIEWNHVTSNMIYVGQQLQVK